VLQEGVLQFALLGAEWVLWLLVGLSLACIALSIERAIYLLSDGTDRSRLAAAVNTFLSDGDAAGFAKKLRELKGFEARILAAGVELSGLGPEAAQKAMTGTATGEKLRMERGLSFLATVGSNAPFVGLFGTVLGIIQAFHDLAVNTAEASEAVMAGISEALVATAVGLLVAIPAVVLYNLFSRTVKGRLSRSESLADLVVARLHGRDERVVEAAAHGK
jgi:biopolymer transport protein ExbB/TolQ